MFSHIECTSHSTISSSLGVTSDSLRASPSAMPKTHHCYFWPPNPKKMMLQQSRLMTYNLSSLFTRHSVSLPWHIWLASSTPLSQHPTHPPRSRAAVCLALLGLYPHVPLRRSAPGSGTTQPWGTRLSIGCSYSIDAKLFSFFPSPDQNHGVLREREGREVAENKEQT